MSIAFVKAGTAPDKTRMSRKDGHKYLLSKANDWKLLVDLPGTNYVFPPEIYSTAERPDILIWSVQLHEVLLVELTCPAEEGIKAAQVRKEGRYLPLLDNITRNTSWKPKLLTVEVGVRGFVSNNSCQAFLRLGCQGRRYRHSAKSLRALQLSVRIPSISLQTPKFGIMTGLCWISIKCLLALLKFGHLGLANTGM